MRRVRECTAARYHGGQEEVKRQGLTPEAQCEHGRCQWWRQWVLPQVGPGAPHSFVDPATEGHLIESYGWLSIPSDGGPAVCMKYRYMLI